MGSEMCIRDREFELKTRFAVHPSTLTQCKRAIVLSACGIAQYTTTQQELMFCVANGAHAMMEHILGLQEGVHCECEKRIKIPEYLLSGIADAVLSGDRILSSYGTERIIVEIKTSGYLKANYTPPVSHIAQLNTYLYGTGIEIGEILTVSRTNGSYNTCTVEIDEELLSSVFSFLDEIYDSLHGGTMPEIDGDCSSCWYYEYCHASDASNIYDYCIRLFNETADNTKEYKERRK